MEKRLAWIEPVIAVAPSDALEHSAKGCLSKKSIATGRDDLVHPQQTARGFNGGPQRMMKRGCR